MSRIKIQDLPVNEKLDKEGAMNIVGGFSLGQFNPNTFGSFRHNSLGNFGSFVNLQFGSFQSSGFTNYSSRPVLLQQQFSDRRLKTDIKKIGFTQEGFLKYSFKYLWGAKTHIGVMADEVPANLLSKTESGFYKVDYSGIDL